MPDISMCQDHACPLRYDCYRFMAEPCELRQAYASFKYTDKCDHFWDCRGYGEMNKEKVEERDERRNK